MSLTGCTKTVYAYYASIAQYFHMGIKYGTRSGIRVPSDSVRLRSYATHAPRERCVLRCVNVASSGVLAARRATRTHQDSRWQATGSGRQREREQARMRRTPRRDSRNAARTDSDSDSGTGTTVTSYGRSEYRARAAHPSSRPSDLHTRLILLLNAPRDKREPLSRVSINLLAHARVRERERETNDESLPPVRSFPHRSRLT